MINRVVLMGRMVADPELKATNGGVSVVSFRIAVDRNYVKNGEERKADFFDIVAWRSTAEFVCKYFCKRLFYRYRRSVAEPIFYYEKGRR